ncbi:MAG: PSD1 and planctomycete cytochrome C domain-containing protein [Luteolibacter sp.]
MKPACRIFLITIAVAAHAGGEVDFAHQVVPILRKRCAECHMQEAKKGGLSMNTRESFIAGSEFGRIVEPGNAKGSLLMEIILSDDKSDRMPPKGPRMPADQVETIRKWIDGGMHWEPGFTFGKEAYEPPLQPRNPEPPPAVDGRTHPVDRFVDAYLAEHEISRPQALGDAAFIRRLTLDLTGLLPEPAEVDAFIADKSPGKREKLIATVLARDTDYAEHWLTFWNDLLRNDYKGTGYIDGGRKPVTAWLYRALLENKPYDGFARELLAPPDNQSSGFIEGIKWRGSVNASQTREVQFSQSISQTFLGLNMKCASCHDSFVDRWKLDDAYGLAAIFADQPIEMARCDKPTGKMAQPKWIFPELGTVDPAAPKPERLKQLAGLMTHPDNGRFTRTIVNRLWHRLMGRGIVHPVDAMDTEPWNEDLLDHLAVRFAGDGHDLKKALAYIASSQLYQSEAVVTGKDDDANVFRGPLAKRMSAEQFVDAVWTITGTAPAKPHQAVQRKADAASKMVRASLVPSDLLMRALGRPNREQIVSMRPDNLTTLEAIDLANGGQLAAALEQGAARLGSQNLATDALVESVYMRALSRRPSPAESRGLSSILGPHPDPLAVEDFLWMVLLLPEFQFVH